MMRDFTFYDLLQHNARSLGDAPAAISAEETVSHQEFLERVDKLAAGITARGIEKGDRICILAQNSIQYLELYGACAKTGAIAYPINWRLTATEVKSVIELASPQMLVVGAGHLEQIEGVDLSELRVSALIGAGAAKAALFLPPGFTPLAELYENPCPPSIPPNSGGEVSQSSEVSSHDPFVVISTAAVAGVPRGAVLSHENIILASYPLVGIYGLSAQDRHLAALPFFHITALGLAFCMTLVGGTNIVLEKFDPTAAVKMIDEHGVTLIADFPPILTMLLDARQAVDAHLNSLKYVFGLDSPDVIQRLYRETNAKFWTGFGQSETSGVVTLTRVDQKPGATGKPIPLVRVRCVNEAAEEVPVGDVGEIVVQGPIVFQGYWRDPEATAYTFRHGWHHTGDMGKFDSEGYLYYAGRKPEKELIKSGGENVYPAEVEQVLIEMPQVAAACIIGVPDAKWGEAVKAIIELHPNNSLTAQDVSTFVAEKIASYKKPRYVEFVEQLPRKENGQIDRIKVKAAWGK